MKKLESLDFDNSFARLPPVFYTRLSPTPIPNPYLASFNPDAAALIDLDPAEAKRPEFVEYFSGNRLPPGAEPLSMIYSGHQFGSYVPQLGDGRAILLGEARNNSGERWDLQLKGAGQTPYSRQGDGRAVLRSSIREYLCGEAMQGLGVPTTRGLCIIGSDMKVYRETVETGAVLVRMAPSHIRFGSFQIFYYRKQFEHLQTLADYVIAHHFPAWRDEKEKYGKLLEEAVLRTARLMAEWQAFGFAHGVMNTDNMSVLGLTFDYGPFGFMEGYDPGYICNHSDPSGRYAFNRQPAIGLWNLSALAQALTPLIPKEQIIEVLDRYEPTFERLYAKLMGGKLGLKAPQEEDRSLIKDLLDLLQEDRIDYTNFFRALGLFKGESEEKSDDVRNLFIRLDRFDAWAGLYRKRLAAEGSRDAERKSRMDLVNPKYILRNYLAQVAIQKAAGHDFSEIDRLLALLKNPFDEQPAMEAYAAAPPDWAKHIEVSCSS